jgi:aspartate kinase
MKVCKFGGSSLADAGQIRKVKKIIEADISRKVIVVSAPGKRHKDDEKITDLLYKCHALRKEGRSIDEPFGIIRSRFLEIAAELKVSASLKETLDRIEEKINAGASADYAASRGEYLSGLMIADYLGAEFIDAEKVIRLTEDGRVDESSYQLLAERVRGEGRVVLPGFYGVTLAGELKTFSRGGSDISGAIAARAVQAEVYENWTDVSGILMADPRIVENPKPIKEITYTEIREMASIGANVFHEEAIAPVKNVGIPIHVKNTNDPAAEGTRIVSERDLEGSAVVGVSGKKPYRKIVIEKFLLNRYPEFPGLVEKGLKSHGLSTDFELKGFDTMTLFVTGKEDTDWEGLRQTILRDLKADGCLIGPETAIIGVVGEGLALRSKVVGASVDALERAGVGLEGLNFGGSPVTLLIAVPLDSYRKVLRILVERVSEL